MHFNFHLSGDESPEQSRRIANAVLALGGAQLIPDNEVNIKLDATPELIRYFEGSEPKTGARWAEEDEPTAPVGGAPSDLPPTRYTSCDLAAGPDVTTVSTVENGKVTSTLVVDEVMTPDEVKAFIDLLPPPIPPTSTVAPSGLDAKGLPWDGRIHSSSRAINADGTWRYRKNVPDETKRDMEAELRGLVQAPRAAPPVPIILPPGSAADITPPSTGPMVPGLVPPSVALGLAPPAPPVPTGALQRTYSDVVNLIMARKVQPDTYVAILGMSLPEFAKHVISAPNDATLMFDALDAASRT